MKRALSSRAAETYVMASAEKLGAASAYRVLPLTDVGGIVTDAKRSNPIVRRLIRAGVRVLT
jgi:DeoR/GlpR family transcriptional regulator of sugar metabolism